MNDRFFKILDSLKELLPEIEFRHGDSFMWSPDISTIFFLRKENYERHDAWALIHEAGHADLKHQDYKNDLSLVRLESEAWERAKTLASRLGEEISEEHIQDCLDTYRDWLHKRSTCPVCGIITLQSDNLSYKCFNCQNRWTVPESPICRVARRRILTN